MSVSPGLPQGLDAERFDRLRARLKILRGLHAGLKERIPRMLAAGHRVGPAEADRNAQEIEALAWVLRILSRMEEKAQARDAAAARLTGRVRMEEP